MAASSHLPFRRIKTRVKRSVAPGCAPGPVPKCAALPSAHRPPLAPTCPSRPQHRYTYESELLLLVNFPAELSCLYQFGERLGVGVQPLSLLLEVTGDIGLHVLIVIRLTVFSVSPSRAALCSSAMTARSSPSGEEELPDCPDRGAPKQQAMCRRITITVVFIRTPGGKAKIKKPPNNRVLHFCPPYSRACAHHKFFLPISRQSGNH